MHTDSDQSQVENIHKGLFHEVVLHIHSFQIILPCQSPYIKEQFCDTSLSRQSFNKYWMYSDIIPLHPRIQESLKPRPQRVLQRYLEPHGSYSVHQLLPLCSFKVHQD